MVHVKIRIDEDGLLELDNLHCDDESEEGNVDMVNE